MEEKNIPENEQNDKKSWLEEQLQKRNINPSSETFSFKDDIPENELNSLNDESTENAQNQENTPEVKSVEIHTKPIQEVNTNLITSENTEITNTSEELSQNEHKVTEPPITNTHPTKPAVSIKWTKKLSSIGQKKLWKDITVKKAIPYMFGGLIFIFLVFNLRYVIFNENKVPTLHNVNVKDTLLSDISVTRVLDPNNPDKDNKKSTKKQGKTTENTDPKNKQANEINEVRTYYRVKAGDKFNDIARKHGLTPAELKELNPKVRPERIQPGQKLRVKKLD